MISTGATMTYAILTTFEYCQFIMKVGCHCTNGMRPFCMAHSVHEYHINSHSLQQFINGWSTISFLKRVPLGKCQVNYHAVSYSIAGEKDSTNCARYNQLLPWYGHYPIGEENRCDYKKVVSILLVIHYAFFQFHHQSVEPTISANVPTLSNCQLRSIHVWLVFTF